MKPKHNTKNAPPKRTLTVNERESINTLIGEKKTLLGATDDAKEGALTVIAPKEIGINKDKLRADIQNLERVLATESPRMAAPKDRDRLERRKNELTEILKNDILETREEIEVLNHNHSAWTTALKKAQQRPRHEPMIAEYREICKQLDPDDPDAGSLDAIRKDR